MLFFVLYCLAKNLSQCSLRYSHSCLDIVHHTEYMQRAGHVILDGVVDPEVWMTYKVIFNAAMVETTTHHQH